MASTAPTLSVTFESVKDGDAKTVFGDDVEEFEGAVKALASAPAADLAKGVALMTAELPLDDGVVELLASPSAAPLLPFVVIADLSNAETFPADIPLPNLRSLDLTSATIPAPPDLTPYPQLLILDLSFVCLDDVDTALASRTLRQLTMDDCEITDASLTSVLGSLPSLTELSVASNELEDSAALASLAPRLPALTVLNASSNPVAESGGSYKSAMTTAWPGLKRLDGASLIMTSSVSGVAAVPGIASTMLTGSFTPVGDSASCSCLEGNPCVDPVNCKDWKNRFKVAEGARRNKLTLPPELRK